MYKITYTGNGIDSEFTFSFPFFQNADIKVAINNELLNEGQYSVIPNNNFIGGKVVFDSAPQNGVQIDIFRKISLNRVIDYQPTEKIDPEDLNSDFNFMLSVCQDLQNMDVDVVDWENVRDNLLTKVEYTLNLITDKLSGGGVLGLYNNLLTVLDGALPQLINDYGSVTERPDVEYNDDYGSL